MPPISPTKMYYLHHQVHQPRLLLCVMLCIPENENHFLVMKSIPKTSISCTCFSCVEPFADDKKCKYSQILDLIVQALFLFIIRIPPTQIQYFFPGEY
jgi:hypothetical protein